MATTYVVLREQENGTFATVDQEEAANAAQACRRVAERLDENQNGALDAGLTHIAVTLRN